MIPIGKTKVGEKYKLKGSSQKQAASEKHVYKVPARTL
jgi:hypothetical protein